ncbi:protein NSP-INTERACTING KINASE 1-like [Asparagus officinalis]|uniref:protein NSP-INTERACTING KINASE 1-like n=1 Tax=Asparagus officinalis TaxID=4686 RepID=UPI00098E3854|nr:protein NSP-INTERACTING KINASE 1-like [Asparagus officinalis]XP_020255353.1 protein NSP-INTERACTING KINASE 1-like [Asparagus officinalis]XP_020255354.1 protein NSP-INTERACTING KINASE 1-like [Asparagus officinalis]
MRCLLGSRLSQSIAISRGFLGLVILAAGVVWVYMFYCKNIANKNSESNPSDPSAQVEVSKDACGSPTEPQRARHFMLKELEQTTNSFDEHNIIGKGSFGSVYKGLLCDVIVVAIKTHQGPPKKEFIKESKQVHCFSNWLLPRSWSTNASF